MTPALGALVQGGISVGTVAMACNAVATLGERDLQTLQVRVQSPYSWSSTRVLFRPRRRQTRSKETSGLPLSSTAC